MFPKHWKVREAHLVCDEIVDCVNKTAPVVDYETEFKMIRTTNVKNGFIHHEDMRSVSEDTYLKWNRRLTPRKGDIVLTREAPLGDVGLIRTNHKFFLGQRTMIYRADGINLNQRFLYYTLMSSYLQGQFRSLGSGSTVEHIRVPDAEKVLIPFPPLNEQVKIASILSAYDDLVEVNKKRIQLLENMAEELYKEWFVRFRFPNWENAEFEKGVPKGWIFYTMSDLVDYYIGGGWGEDFPSMEYSEEAYVIRGTDIPNINNNIFKGVPFRYHKPSNIKSRQLQEYDLVFEVSGGSTNQLLGRNTMISKSLLDRFDNKVMCASFCKLIRFNLEKVNPYFIKYYMKLYYDFDLVGVYQVQSTGISNYQFESFLKHQTLRVPEHSIMDEFEGLVKPIVNEIENLGRRVEILEANKSQLLPRLMSGKLSVEDLDIEFPLSMQATDSNIQ